MYNLKSFISGGIPAATSGGIGYSTHPAERNPGGMFFYLKRSTSASGLGTKHCASVYNSRVLKSTHCTPAAVGV